MSKDAQTNVMPMVYAWMADAFAIQTMRDTLVKNYQQLEMPALPFYFCQVRIETVVLELSSVIVEDARNARLVDVQSATLKSVCIVWMEHCQRMGCVNSKGNDFIIKYHYKV